MTIPISNQAAHLRETLVLYRTLQERGFMDGDNDVAELVFSRVIQLASLHRKRFERRDRDNKPITDADRKVMQYLGETVKLLDKRLSLRIDFGTCRIEWHSEVSGTVRMEIPTW